MESVVISFKADAPVSAIEMMEALQMMQSQIFRLQERLAEAMKAAGIADP
ncbi:hypothetical protein SAMN06264348_10272 [Oceanospirillum linum]|nr:hypothetical protein SAMN04489856_10572 [Oleiphilus messinensis]SMP09016.1 hypothetical protein SAMN06264348_10272 [Oceanospirillum linum]